MSLARFASRSMLASAFVTGGYNAAKNAEALVPTVDRFLEKLPHRVTGMLPDQVRAADLIRVNGWTMVGAGSALALGVLPRLASGVLAAQLVPTTLAGHPFWSAPAEKKASTRSSFITNVALAGGLLGVALGPQKGKRARKKG
ncbi:MAG: DoxX family protein [Propionibacteriaceae bacterium]|jgi:uncharacterized membrane protein YphA (DoxX/SURF4 family)|uniref:DoxX family n=1 Tax=Propionibacterium ruminifibrarum TaxID=1962131 RepID=A0A375I371_9ACTN|nr:DoxX family protein [Propionibacterium ruminifibrarum]MBE6477194.1 DoxX family protein [Propionibacteriaceae bacterium]SPF68578.1 DoxX family [Propionibacterium ruminifibrarum]